MHRRLLHWLLAALTLAAPALATGQPQTPAAPPAAEAGWQRLPPRHNRHALIIGLAHYRDPAVEVLPGAIRDMASATQMAEAMQVPDRNIRYLRNEQATGDAIRQAIGALEARVQPGDRVFLHFSGHGTRFQDLQAGGCVEALLAYDGGPAGTITHRELSQLLAPLTRKADKLFVMIDACYSGGLIAPAASTPARALALAGDEGRLRPKFAGSSDACSRPANLRTRSLLGEATAQGALPQDIVHLSSSRSDELSFDDERHGGLATQSMRDCLLRDAVDRDQSGAISMEELRACAQEKIDRRLRHHPQFQAHHLVLAGNASFVPAWFGPGRPVAGPAAVAAAVSGAQALQQLHDQRDAKREVRVAVERAALRIGQDVLAFTVQSDRPGWLYIAMAGSDNRQLQLLFPNDLDSSNQIEAGRPMAFPREGWRLRAGGPPGRNAVLVIVADGPRDLSSLAATKAGPFAMSLNDAAGRADLGALLTRSRAASDGPCAIGEARPASPLCSDAFGAALFTVEELP